MLVHWASGMKVQHLAPIMLERYVATMVLLPPYTAAKRAAHTAIDCIIANMGPEETLRRMNAAPIINRKGKRT